MKVKTLKNGFGLPVLGLGTWRMGGGREADSANDEQDLTAIKEALGLGYTHIDTAQMYAGGHAEELVGQAIKDHDRTKLIITTKVSPQNLAYESVLAAAKESLKRLGAEYIDLYLVHAPNPMIPLSETMKAMDELVNQGLVRYIGVSNFDVGQLKEAQSFAKNKIVCNQIEYNLLARDNGQYTQNMESEMLPYCVQNDILVTAYRPLAKGLLSTQENEILESLSRKYNKTQSQIAVNWLISKDNVVTIVKSSNPEHLKENLGALDWELEKEDLELLNEWK